MKKKFLILPLALTALLLAGCQGNEAASDPPPTQPEGSVSPEQTESAGQPLASPPAVTDTDRTQGEDPSEDPSDSPNQSESQSPSESPNQNESQSPSQSPTPSAATVDPAKVGGVDNFTAGTWRADTEYYFFDRDSTYGRTVGWENGTGVAFSFEPDGKKVVFHMGAADDSSPCTVEVTDAEHLILHWDSGEITHLTYVSDKGTGEFLFYTDMELCSRALTLYLQAHGEDAIGMTAAAATNEDGTVTIQLYQSQGDHNSTAVWYVVDRVTGQGTDKNTGEAVNLGAG